MQIYNQIHKVKKLAIFFMFYAQTTNLKLPIGAQSIGVDNPTTLDVITAPIDAANEVLETHFQGGFFGENFPFRPEIIIIYFS